MSGLSCKHPQGRKYFKTIEIDAVSLIGIKKLGQQALYHLHSKRRLKRVDKA
jgi:hypothetical protein